MTVLLVCWFWHVSVLIKFHEKTLEKIKLWTDRKHSLQKELAFLILHCIENLHNSFIHFTNNFFIKIYFFTKLFFILFLPSFLYLFWMHYHGRSTQLYCKYSSVWSKSVFFYIINVCFLLLQSVIAKAVVGK